MPYWLPAFLKRVSLLSAYAGELPHASSKNTLLGNICQRYSISGSAGAMGGPRSSSGSLLPLGRPSAPGIWSVGRGGSRIFRPSPTSPRSEQPLIFHYPTLHTFPQIDVICATRPKITQTQLRNPRILLPFSLRCLTPFRYMKSWSFNSAFSSSVFQVQMHYQMGNVGTSSVAKPMAKKLARFTHQGACIICR